MSKQKSKAQSSPKKATKASKTSSSQLLAVIRVRGRNNVHYNISYTLDLMNLRKLNNLTFIKTTPVSSGMLFKGKDWVTWGEVNVEMVTHVLSKWGRKDLTDAYVKEHTKGKYANISALAKALVALKAEIKDVPGLKPFFRLHPPSKGHKRGGIKKPFTVGGALGYRGEEINGLIKQMA